MRLFPCFFPTHNSFLQSYDDSDSDLTDCVHHPGFPVFHEGYAIASGMNKDSCSPFSFIFLFSCKYWSCCQKKTTDFNEFLRQEGCTTGRHEWKNEKVFDAHNIVYVCVRTYIRMYCVNEPPLSIICICFG